jgi:hypothetical protein
VELTTDQKGAIAEAEIAAAAIKLGVGVFKPLSDGERYDLIFDLRPALLRVQCKWAPLEGDVVVIRCYSCRRARDGLRRASYGAGQIDVIAAYCAQLDRCFLLTPDTFDGHPVVCVRVRSARNNQRLRINWANDFNFEARLTALLGP